MSKPKMTLEITKGIKAHKDISGKLGVGWLTKGIDLRLIQDWILYGDNDKTRG